MDVVTLFIKRGESLFHHYYSLSWHGVWLLNPPEQCCIPMDIVVYSFLKKLKSYSPNKRGEPIYTEYCHIQHLHKFGFVQ
jgi:hypothetical protein